MHSAAVARHADLMFTSSAAEGLKAFSSHPPVRFGLKIAAFFDVLEPF
jgi:hypothetical protein